MADGGWAGEAAAIRWWCMEEPYRGPGMRISVAPAQLVVLRMGAFTLGMVFFQGPEAMVADGGGFAGEAAAVRWWCMEDPYGTGRWNAASRTVDLGLGLGGCSPCPGNSAWSWSSLLPKNTGILVIFLRAQHHPVSSSRSACHS